jgi:hypothetical protein
MGDLVKITCARCGKSFEAKESVKKGFCLFCGAGFGAEDAPGADGLADRLYRRRDWKEILKRYKGARGGARLRIYRILAGFYDSRQKYVADITEMVRARSGKDYFKSILGADPFVGDPIHEDYNNKARNDIESFISEAERAGESLKDLVEEAAAELAETLLAEKNRETPVYWCLLACEHLAVGLVPFIPLPKLEEIYRSYILINPKNQSLPNQIRVRKTIEEGIKARGGRLPRRGFWKVLGGSSK